MSNPLNNQNNPITETLNFLKNGGSKQDLINKFIKSNPNLNMLNSIRNPREMVMTMARQRGIDINKVEELARILSSR